jgi:DNA-binding MarR family transcriptional regulator
MARRIRTLRDRDFQRLLRFRDGLRTFQHWSEAQARAVGLTGTQHQLLLAVRGHGSPPSVRDVAEHLLLRHHSVVEQIDRAERSGLVVRTADPDDHRVVRISLTELGEDRLTALSQAHLEELSRLQETFASLWRGLPE